MSLAEIVREIDSYLLRLEQARNLLTQSVVPERSRQRRPLTPAKAVSSERVAHDAVITARTRRNKTRKVKLRAWKAPAGSQSLPSLTVGSSPAADEGAADMARPASAPPRRTAQMGAAREKGCAAPPERRPIRLRDTAPKQQWAGPATALTGSVPSGWIGISAEEAQRSREHKNMMRAKPTHVDAPATALAGRRAFEAIFGSAEESSDGAVADAAPDSSSARESYSCLVSASMTGTFAGRSSPENQCISGDEVLPQRYVCPSVVASTRSAASLGDALHWAEPPPMAPPAKRSIRTGRKRDAGSARIAE